jgi:fructokinase
LRIGVDLGGTKIEVAALDPAGTAVARRRVMTPGRDYPATVATVRDLVLAVEGELGRACTVGIAMPGAISPATGLVKNANSTCLIGHRLDRDLALALQREVRLANDADCFALSEAVDGAAAAASSVFGVILGTGVGGGIVIGGRLLAGPNAIAGEWGHNPLPWPQDSERPGPPCYCGKSGCIESFLSGPALAADHHRVTGLRLSAEAVAQSAGAGDAAAVASLARYADRLARGLASVINIVDPEIIVLGGGLSQIASLYRDVPLLWGRYVFSEVVTTPLVPPRHGDSSGVRGAAWLWPEASP